MRVNLLVAVLLAMGLGISGGPASASPDEPRYCAALIDARAAAPDDSLFPINTKRKERLVEKAMRRQNRLFTKAYLIAKADGDRVAASGLYWVPRAWLGNEKAFREYMAGDAQAKSDCGIGFI